MKFSVEINIAARPAQMLEYDGPVVHIGRDPTCELALDQGMSGVSWRHARIESTPGGLVATDLGSTNGTYVNDRRIASPTALNMGDTIGLGQRGPRLRLAGLNGADGEAAASSSPSKIEPEPPSAAAVPFTRVPHQGGAFLPDSDPRPTMLGVMSTFREPPAEVSAVRRFFGPGLGWRLLLLALGITVLALAVGTVIWLINR